VAARCATASRPSTSASADGSVTFAPVMVEGAAPSSAAFCAIPGGAIEIALGAAVVRVGPGSDVATLTDATTRKSRQLRARDLDLSIRPRYAADPFDRCSHHLGARQEWLRPRDRFVSSLRSIPQPGISRVIRCRDPVRRSERLTLIQLRMARKHVAVVLGISKPERAVELGVPLPSLKQAFGLEPFEVRQIAQGG
jgi:hypothetical protein